MQCGDCRLQATIPALQRFYGYARGTTLLLWFNIIDYKMRCWRAGRQGCRASGLSAQRGI